MADTEYFDDGYRADSDRSAAAAAPGLGALVNWAGALISLGLVLGMGVWAVQLTMRDVSGVPVIQAIEGPMRVPPADPGGTQAPHQGLAVNRIAEGEEAQPVPDRLVLAPPPVELQEVRFETGSGAGTAPAPRPEREAENTAAEASGEASGADTAALIDRLLREAQSEGAVEVPGETTVSGAAEDAAEDAPPDPDTALAAAPEPAPRPEVGTSAFASVIPASVPGVARSPRPSLRPASLAVAVPGDAETSSAVEEIPVSELADGTRLVQLGAFDTPQIARGEWDRLAARFPDYFEGRPRVIEEASSGGQTFFRLRAAGFDDLAGSRRFCAVLVAQGAACIPVTVR
jgi:hypothetical protein